MTPDDSPVMVTLQGGFQVPERFTVQLHGRPRRTPITCEVAVEMVKGKPYLRSLALAVTVPESRALSAADLAELNLKDVLDAAVQQAATQHTPMRWSALTGDEPIRLQELIAATFAEVDAHSAGALTAARAARNTRRITPDDLRRVRELYAAKGIHGVMSEMGYSERNARRLLARARRELS